MYVEWGYKIGQNFSYPKTQNILVFKRNFVIGGSVLTDVSKFSILYYQPCILILFTWGINQADVYRLYRLIQEEGHVLGGDTIGHCETKSLYVHVSISE